MCMIKLLCVRSTSCVKVGGANTEGFGITTSVRQSGVLYLIIVVIVLDWILKRVNGGEEGIE